MDFTIEIYKALISKIIDQGYDFLTYKEFHLKEVSTENKIITLRHDVDLKKENSLRFAKIQAENNIKGTYYFRIIPESYNEDVIKEIASYGHEIGYHYETMDTSKGNIDKAYDEFCYYLEKFRKFTQIETVCMHGSPMSKFDNRDIWKKYNYKDLGIIAEPYFDVDFNDTYYLTDTGRRWDGAKVSVRDKAMNTNPVTNSNFTKRNYHTTKELIQGFDENDFPTKIMMTFHPQRWTDNKIEWTKELIMQNLKNQVKRLLIK
jgi:hypothetical protein